MHAKLQLDIVVDEFDLLTGLECGQSDIGASVAAKRIAQRTVSAAANLALDGKVNLGEIVVLELHWLRRCW